MKRTLLSAALALSTFATAPAEAGGSVNMTLNAENAQQSQVIKTGLGLYATHKQIKSNGHVSQNGNGNSAGLYQSGSGQLGIVEQHGNNHQATLSQTGRGNSCGVFQFGEGTSANVDQSGNGEACLVLQAGWE